MKYFLVNCPDTDTDTDVSQVFSSLALLGILPQTFIILYFLYTFMSSSKFDMWNLICNERGGHVGFNGVVEAIYKLKCVFFFLCLN